MGALNKIILDLYKNDCFTYSDIITLPGEIYVDLNMLSQEEQKIACKFAYKKRFDKELNRFKHLEEFYYKSEGSSSKFKKFLEFQNIDCDLFRKDFIDWLSCKDFRKNLFFIYGGIGTGKSMFRSFIQDIFKCCAVFSAGSQKSDFYWEQLINSVIGIINEPYYNAFKLEDIKSLACGEGISVNAKFVQSTSSFNRRIPLLLLSNFIEVSRGYGPPISESSVKDKSYLYSFNNTFKNSDNICTADFVNFLFN